MKFSAAALPLSNITSDIVASFVVQDKDSYRRTIDLLAKELGLSAPEKIIRKDFSAKEGESHLLYTKSAKVPRLLLIGLGESKNVTLEKIRRASAAAAKKSRSAKVSSLTLHPGSIPESLDHSLEEFATAVAEGALLSLYRYDRFLTAGNGNTLTSITLLAHRFSDAKLFSSGISIGSILASATIHARDLKNAPGNLIFPESLANDIRMTGRKNRFSVAVFDEKKIRNLHMGGIIAVSSGSDKQSRFITMEYGKQYAKKSGPVVLVGKGVTFDSGGISIKPAANMAEMKMDMGGAAAVIGTMQAAAQLKLRRHIVGLIPSVENMLSGSAMKPGDIVRHYNGKTSEVDNTDAEGRLILADALSYAAKFKPALVIDLATLTGAVVVALGHYATGMMGNDQQAMDALKKAGDKTYERVWQLPMFDEYEKQIKSDVADVKNVGGRWGGAITAGWFLKKFIGDYHWVHLDIAGTAILESDQDYTPRGGSGVGVRLLIEFLRHWK